MKQAETIAETLAGHHDWAWSIRRGEMSCKGEGCAWTRAARLTEPCAPMFRQHQAEMIAAAVATAPPAPEQAPTGHREDLTMFAAVIAKLGGEATVTFAEAQRVTGVHVTRWDEPAHMRYRFTLDVPEFRDLPPARISLRMDDGTYKTADEIRAEAAGLNAVVEYEAGDPEPKLRIPPTHQCEAGDLHYLGDGTGNRFCATCGKDQ